MVKNTLFDEIIDESGIDMDESTKKRKPQRKTKTSHDRDDHSFCRECEVKKMQDDLALLTSVSRRQKHDEYATVNKPSKKTVTMMQSQESISQNRSKEYQSFAPIKSSVSHPDVKKMQEEIHSLKQEVEFLKKKLSLMEVKKK